MVIMYENLLPTLKAMNKHAENYYNQHMHL